eukprot:gene24134-biopygen19392
MTPWEKRKRARTGCGPDRIQRTRTTRRGPGGGSVGASSAYGGGGHNVRAPGSSSQHGYPFSGAAKVVVSMDTPGHCGPRPSLSTVHFMEIPDPSPPAVSDMRLVAVDEGVLLHSTREPYCIECSKTPVSNAVRPPCRMQ